MKKTVNPRRNITRISLSIQEEGTNIPWRNLSIQKKGKNLLVEICQSYKKGTDFDKARRRGQSLEKYDKARRKDSLEK